VSRHSRTRSHAAARGAKPTFAFTLSTVYETRCLPMLPDRARTP
jgi:hypothetical protein